MNNVNTRYQAQQGVTIGQLVGGPSNHIQQDMNRMPAFNPQKMSSQQLRAVDPASRHGISLTQPFGRRGY